MNYDFGNVILDDGVNVKLLNEYLASIFTKENFVYIPMYNKTSNINALYTAILLMRQCMMNFESSGSTNLLVLMEYIQLKNLARVISKPLSYILNQSLSCNVVPHNWMLANVTLLFKKGPNDKASSYRPVGLTSQVCKIMESTLRDNIINNLEQSGLVRDSQHGFKAG